jgi:hypothetical protein
MVSTLTPAASATRPMVMVARMARLILEKERKVKLDSVYDYGD